MEDVKRVVRLLVGEGKEPACPTLWVEEVAIGSECSYDGDEEYLADRATHRHHEESLVKAARLAGILLAGRSLLREEAVQLLGDVMLAEHSADYLAALQFAALTGALQLTAAVAPKPSAPPLHGFRALAERLRPAQLLGLAAAPRRPDNLALYCRRCGSGHDKMRRTPCAACGQACAYCEACLTMGRSRQCGLLVIGVPQTGATSFFTNSQTLISTLAPSHAQTPSPTLVPAHASALSPAHTPGHAPTSSPTHAPAPTPENLSERWGLSPAQCQATITALQYLNNPHRNTSKPSKHSSTFLLWAVTGAGKTEMIFPLLEAVLTRGGRALLATPRRDVVLELAPRLAKALPNYSRTVLYGGSTDRWENGALTLATTHQLLRFQEAFDLVLIDELDAFPYHNDPMLHYAANKCRKKSGFTVLLSATPPLQLQRAVARRRLPCARVPVRYHRHPLPVPQRLAFPALNQWLRKQKLPNKLLKPLQRSIKRGAQVFLFVPYVRQVEPLVKLLRRYASILNIAPHAIDGTSSKDAERNDKVTFFRDHSLSLLVTTTILERGVTIPKSDVFILDAGNPLFDAASLVQMAGRAGRSSADPFGLVYFGAPVWTTSQRSSIQQIRSMNSLAKQQGYLQ
ncbi:DEAD/DEAH box helicase family protein [Cohnella sp. NL03-T5]|nr:DEAD/DEAH box helicase family protein [Cohnella silvisoli]